MKTLMGTGTMSSLYGEYIKEREGRDIVETEGGFATYVYVSHKDMGKCCYIVDIYTRPDFRSTGLGQELANDIKARAVAEGCKYLIGSVDPRANNATKSLELLLKFGFELHCIEGPLVYFKMKLNGGTDAKS